MCIEKKEKRILEKCNACRPDWNDALTLEGRRIPTLHTCSKDLEKWRVEFRADYCGSGKFPKRIVDPILCDVLESFIEATREEAIQEGYERGRIKCLEQHGFAGQGEIKKLIKRAKEEERNKIEQESVVAFYNREALKKKQNNLNQNTK